MTDVPTTMTAVVLDEPGPVESLHLRQVPVPTPLLGWVLIADGEGADGGEHVRPVARHSSAPRAAGVQDELRAFGTRVPGRRRR
jgi:hypothetical protein